ncbi:MAG: NTP transferase domain-containing protein [Burkholderiaceae bacterium]
MGCINKANGLYSRMSVGAVLLAAGSASRMGSRPKCLLELGGVPLVMRQLIALSGAGVDEVVVVLGHYADQVEAAVAHLPITLVRNPSPDDGQASSVRLGLEALSPQLDAVIVALADQPMIDAPDITTLISAFRQRGDKAMVVPRLQSTDGKWVPGNPVILSGELRQQWLAGQDDAMCRTWRQQHPEQIKWLDTNNRHYTTDLDTPEDLKRFEAETGHALIWPGTVEPLAPPAPVTTHSSLASAADKPVSAA